MFEGPGKWGCGGRMSVEGGPERPVPHRAAGAMQADVSQMGGWTYLPAEILCFSWLMYPALVQALYYREE